MPCARRTPASPVPPGTHRRRRRRPRPGATRCPHSPPPTSGAGTGPMWHVPPGCPVRPGNASRPRRGIVSGARSRPARRGSTAGPAHPTSPDGWGRVATRRGRRGRGRRPPPSRAGGDGGAGDAAAGRGTPSRTRCRPGRVRRSRSSPARVRRGGCPGGSWSQRPRRRARSSGVRRRRGRCRNGGSTRPGPPRTPRRGRAAHSLPRPSPGRGVSHVPRDPRAGPSTNGGATTATLPPAPAPRARPRRGGRGRRTPRGRRRPPGAPHCRPDAGPRGTT